jgi:hypothetical protein
MTKAKISDAQIREAFEYNKDNGNWRLETLQIVILVAAGGGMLGRFLAEQPGQGYIDMRVGKLPYPKRDIMKMVNCLKIMAEVQGLNPNQLPAVPSFHNCGVF